MKRALVTMGALAALVTIAPGARAAPVTMGARAPNPPADADVRSVLADPRYRFCHEDDYPLEIQEHAWCPAVGDRPSACPSLARACKLPPVETRWSFGAPPHGRGAPITAVPEDDERQRPSKLSLPDLSGVAKVLFFGLIVVFVIGVARALLRNVLRDRAADEGAGDAPPDPDAGAAPAALAPRGPVETDVERLLARARAAAAQGDYARAVDDAYAALLRRLDGDGLIEIHPSRTNGDYVRTLRDRPELRGVVGQIVREVEGVQFGATPPSERVFRSVLERVIPLVSRALVLALVCLGLADTSCSRRSQERVENTPSGTAAVVDLLKKRGLEVRHRGEALGKLDRPLTLVLLPGLVVDEAEWKVLFEWVEERGGALVFSGLPPHVPEQLHLCYAIDVPDKEASSAVTADWSPMTEVLIPPGLHLVDAAGALWSDDHLARRLDGKGRPGEAVVAVYRELGAGKVIVFADERFLTNIGLAAGENAQLLVDILRLPTASSEVELCDQWTGAGASTPLQSVNSAHLTPVVVQLFILMALLFLWKGRAFARLRDPPAEARRSFADHARALGLAYQRARASRHVTGLYAVWALERLRERVHRAGRQGLIPLAEAIAARTGRPEGEVMSVLVEANSARDEAAPPSSFRGHREPPARHRKDAAAADLALMQALMSFLAATGQRRPTDSHKPR